MDNGIQRNKFNQALLDFSATYNADALDGPVTADTSAEDGKQKQPLSGFQLLSGDAGFRRYLRILSDPTTMAVDAPPEKENNLAFVRTNLLLAWLGLGVPRIHAVDFSQGFFLLEDFGDTLLCQKVLDGRSDEAYSLAVDQLIRLQRCQACPSWMPIYDDKLLRAELELFRRWFLSELLSMSVSDPVSKLLTNFFEMLIDSALDQPSTLVHRDFHARNLMWLSDGSLGVIDFQDAVWGPIAYDAVSLARDCYLHWSDSRLQRFISDYVDRLVEENLLAEADRDKFPRWFDLMGLQRHIKVLGIFARLYLRDEKPGYLNDLPLVLRYTLEVMSKYEECAEVTEWILTEVIPVCEVQPWYEDWRTAGSEVEVP